MKRTPYKVEYRILGKWHHVAKFDSYDEAMWFAKSQHDADVIDTRKNGGLIGQWRGGTASDEFHHLNTEYPSNSGAIWQPRE